MAPFSFGGTHMEEINFNNSITAGKQQMTPPTIKDISEKDKDIKPIEGARFAKPTLSKKLKKTFGSIVVDDLKHVGDDLVERIIIPSIRGGICNTLISAVSMIFGGSPRNGYMGYPGYQYTNYNVSNASWRQPDRYDNRSPYDKYGYRTENNSGYYTRMSYMDVEIPTYEKAMEVIHDLYKLKSRYPVVSVLDFFSCCQLTGDFTDDQWGWYDLPTLTPVYIQGSDDMWRIPLPKPVPIKR